MHQGLWNKGNTYLCENPLSQHYRSWLLISSSLYQKKLPFELKVKPTWWNDNEFCEYHRNKGHKTNNCHKLKNIIQYLIGNSEIKVEGNSIGIISWYDVVVVIDDKLVVSGLVWSLWCKFILLFYCWCNCSIGCFESDWVWNLLLVLRIIVKSSLVMVLVSWTWWLCGLKTSLYSLGFMALFVAGCETYP